MSKIYVIIVTYNGKIWYERCFSSLRNSIAPIQTIVVDNASSDDTVAYIKKNYPEIILIESNKNLGFGQGNNIGIRYALDNAADYVFLLNQDAWIESDTISELVKIQQENPTYGILSPINLTASKEHILDGFIEILTDYKNVDCSWVDDLYFNRLKNVYNIKSVNAAAWLIPKIILNTVGGFDPLFFHYGEDDNYLQRVHYHGFGVGICPKVSIVHDADTSKQYNQHLRKDAYKRHLLVTCANITDDTMPQASIRLLIHKLLKKTIPFKKKAFLFYYQELKHFLHIKKEIQYSRNVNKRKAQNWL